MYFFSGTTTASFAFGMKNWRRAFITPTLLCILFLELRYGIFTDCSRTIWEGFPSFKTPPSVLVSKNCSLTTNRSRRILIWTKVFGDTYEKRKNVTPIFELHSACDHQCHITSDRSLFQVTDAVVFHERDIDPLDMPTTRPQQQKWVFWSRECPAYSNSHLIRSVAHVFNWTMIYRHDSDVFVPYGNLVKFNSTAETNRSKVWQSKSVLAVWPASNCHTVSKREVYVRELRKYVGVDVYGLCGDHDCEKWKDMCHQLFESKYFFWLSFENAVCRDYVTEKLFIPLMYDIIPVVLGGANYTRHVPRGSYINALDFSSPKALAVYLEYVAANFTVYESFFNWKKEYKSVRKDFLNLCSLCSKLHSRDVAVETFYQDLLAWWEKAAKCTAWEKLSLARTST